MHYNIRRSPLLMSISPPTSLSADMFVSYTAIACSGSRFAVRAKLTKAVAAGGVSSGSERRPKEISESYLGI